MAAAAVANNILLTCEGITAASERATAQRTRKPERPTSAAVIVETVGRCTRRGEGKRRSSGQSVVQNNIPLEVVSEEEEEHL